MAGQGLGLARGTRVWAQTDGGLRLATVVDAAAAATVELDADERHGAAAQLQVPAAALQPANPTLLDGVRCGAWMHAAGGCGPALAAACR